jgi:hypothetical protein
VKTGHGQNGWNHVEYCLDILIMSHYCVIFIVCSSHRKNITSLSICNALPAFVDRVFVDARFFHASFVVVCSQVYLVEFCSAPKVEMFWESHFLTFLLPHHHLFLQVVLSPLPSSSDSDPVDSGMLLLLFANGTDSLFSLQAHYDLEIVLATGGKFDFTLM